MNNKIIYGFASTLFFPCIVGASEDNCVTGYEGFNGWGSVQGVIEGITISETCYTDSTHTEKLKTTFKTYDVDSHSGYYLDRNGEGELIYTNGNENIILNEDNTIKVTESKGYNGSEHATEVNTKWIWPNGETTYSTNYFDTDGSPVGHTAEFNGGTIVYTLNDQGNFEIFIDTYNNGDIVMQVSAIMKPPFGSSLMSETGTMNFHLSKLENVKLKNYDYGNTVVETTCDVNSVSSLSVEGLDIDYNSCQQKEYTKEEFANLQTGSETEAQTEQPTETYKYDAAGNLISVFDSKGQRIWSKRIYTVEEARAAVEAAGTDTVKFRIRYK